MVGHNLGGAVAGVGRRENSIFSAYETLFCGPGPAGVLAHRPGDEAEGARDLARSHPGLGHVADPGLLPGCDVDAAHHRASQVKRQIGQQAACGGGGARRSHSHPTHRRAGPHVRRPDHPSAAQTAVYQPVQGH